MTSTNKIFFFGLAIALSALAGIYHGQRTDRWGLQPEAIEAQKKCADLPEEIGRWRLVKNVELEKDVLQVLNCHAYRNAVYRDAETGRQLTVCLLVGPPGEISVHTPEICYSQQDYEITRERVRQDLRIDGSDHSFWVLDLKSRQATGVTLRSAYAWSEGTKWIADDNPRYKFGAYSHLYKIQIAGPGNDADDFDYCKNFLEEIVPSINRMFVPAKYGI